MKQTEHRPVVTLSEARLEWLLRQASYRTAMRVTELMVYRSSGTEDAGYFVCPRCRVTLEREFVPFCDRCGQRLNWKGCKYAKVIR